MSLSNEELCERVLPKWPEDTQLISCSPCLDANRKLLEQALTQGILIPAEKMLTVEEIKKTIEKMAYPDIKFPEMIAKAIHQASRQKAGL